LISIFRNKIYFEIKKARTGPDRASADGVVAAERERELALRPMETGVSVHPASLDVFYFYAKSNNITSNVTTEQGFSNEIPGRTTAETLRGCYS